MKHMAQILEKFCPDMKCFGDTKLYLYVLPV